MPRLIHMSADNGDIEIIYFTSDDDLLETDILAEISRQDNINYQVDWTDNVDGYPTEDIVYVRTPFK